MSLKPACVSSELRVGPDSVVPPGSVTVVAGSAASWLIVSVSGANGMRLFPAAPWIVTLACVFGGGELAAREIATEQSAAVPRIATTTARTLMNPPVVYPSLQEIGHDRDRVRQVDGAAPGLVDGLPAVRIPLAGEGLVHLHQVA